jgi:hypothetical protein
MEDEIKEVINELTYEREQYGERIVSLYYAYDSALEKLSKLIGVEFKPYDY